MKICFQLTLKNVQSKIYPNKQSKVTINYYVFEKFIGNDTLINTVNKNTKDDYILYLRENNHCNDITINSYLRSIRVFFYFCMDGGYLERLIISIPKADKKLKETYTEDELKLLLKKPDIKTCDFIEYRMWVYSNYLLATGNRISSVLNL